MQGTYWSLALMDTADFSYRGKQTLLRNKKYALEEAGWAELFEWSWTIIDGTPCVGGFLLTWLFDMEFLLDWITFVSVVSGGFLSVPAMFSQLLWPHSVAISGCQATPVALALPSPHVPLTISLCNSEWKQSTASQCKMKGVCAAEVIPLLWRGHSRHCVQLRSWNRIGCKGFPCDFAAPHCFLCCLGRDCWDNDHKEYRRESNLLMYRGKCFIYTTARSPQCTGT